MNWILPAILIFIAVNIPPFFILAGVLYRVLLVRTDKEKWGRQVSLPDDPEYVRLYQDAIAWNTAHLSCLRELEVENDGFRLCAQYFDFGHRKSVIIIPGRMECCIYSCHYAEPYRAAGYNVLTIDVRAHGLSEGKFCALGNKEYRDVLAWARLLHDRMGVEEVVLHGICMGAGSALFALADRNCPDYITAMVADGMFVNFAESFRNHLVEKKKPVFPFYPLVMAYIWLFTGVNAVKDGPLSRIGCLKKPILFLHGKEDVYSLPEKTEQLFAACGSERKEIVWFDRGGHSRLRVNDPELYDRSIRHFLASQKEEG